MFRRLCSFLQIFRKYLYKIIPGSITRYKSSRHGAVGHLYTTTFDKIFGQK